MTRAAAQQLVPVMIFPILMSSSQVATRSKGPNHHPGKRNEPSISKEIQSGSFFNLSDHMMICSQDFDQEYSDFQKFAQKLRRISI